jgi:succinylglutamic semialdehyde dehydrogenase
MYLDCDKDVEEKIEKGKKAFHTWALSTLEFRLSYLLNFQKLLKEEKESIALEISKEIGKPLWESLSEVNSCINKIDISLNSYLERTGDHLNITFEPSFSIKHRPHGLLAVLGPFNFPLHLPLGQIIPALLSGNTVIFKPSEKANNVAFRLLALFKKAGFPSGVFTVVFGGKTVAEKLATSKEVDGLLFTGSYEAGLNLSRLLSKSPEKLLALEMGGNNPLVIWDIKDFKPAIYTTLVSAYLSSGQRCSCARRLIIKKGSFAEAFIPQLVDAIKNLKVGFYSDTPEPFMGPLVSLEASQRLLDAERYLLSLGATSIIPLRVEKSCLVHPGLIDVTDIPLELRPDVEYFGPLLQLSLVDNFHEALNEAKSTRYGLVASLLTDNKSLFNDFYTHIKAGLIHLNAPTTGATSYAPFGGVGISGNLRPGGYYAADFCAYPVVSFENDKLNIPQQPLPGINL